MSIHLHRGDLPDGLELGGVVAVDSETMGLHPDRDRLCLVQLSSGDGTAHLVQLAARRLCRPEPAPAARRSGLPQAVPLRALRPRGAAALSRGRLPAGLLHQDRLAPGPHLHRPARPEGLARELLGIDLDKAEQSSDWGAAELTETQLRYAARDVLHLHALRARLDAMLAREGRTGLAQACFDFLPTRAELDLAGWPDQDIFAH